jgi:cell division septation protein DedD
MRDYEEKSYYEIQLDNKQLILVFLAAVTVCVLIFVLGVMIGKGQKEAEFAAASRDEKKLAAAEPDSNVPSQPLEDIAEEARTEQKSTPKEPVADKIEPEKTDTRNEPKKTATVTPVKQKEEAASQQQKYAYEELDKTETPVPVAEKPKTESTPVAEKPKETEPVSTAAVTEGEEPKPANGSRYTVQVMATSSKPKAEEQVTRLKSKGYTPFMDESKTGDISVFKVRVGRFADTQDAKEMAQKIKTDLKVETWVAPLD